MPKERFYFHLLEVTIVQMLKAHGFDKAANRHVLEIFVDITVRYFNLMAKTVMKYMDIRDDCAPNIKDIAKAFLELDVITPNKQLDKYDASSVTKTGIENFEKWFNSEINERMREVARPDRMFLDERKKAKLKVQKVSSKMDDLTKALDEQSKQAQLQNPTMPYLPSPSVGAGQGRTPSSMSMTMYGQGFAQMSSLEGPANEPNHTPAEQTEEVDYEIPTEAIEEDWIRYLIRDQIMSYVLNQKLNGDTAPAITSTTSAIANVNNPKLSMGESANVKPAMFRGTILQEYIPKDLMHLVDDGLNGGDNDFLIAGPMSEKLLHTFPYYRSDDESSDENDSMDDSSDEDSDKVPNERDIATGSLENKENTQTSDSTQHVDVDNHANAGLAEYDYYEHHNVYGDQLEDLDLYGQGEADSNGLNLFG